MTGIYSPYLTEEDVKDRVRRYVKSYGGVRACARVFNCNPADITHLLNGNRGPSPALLHAFGLEKIIYYVHKEFSPTWATEKKNA